MERSRLQELLEKLPGLSVAVAGDLFLDRYFLIDPALDEPSLETGKAAWQVVETRLSAGAAGTVLNNLSDLGIGRLYAISLLGEDGEGWELRRLLGDKRVDLSLTVSDPALSTPFYTKPMFAAAQGTAEEGNRIDRKNRRTTREDLQQRIVDSLRSIAGQVDAIILLDQLVEEDCGVVTAAVRAAAQQLEREHPSLTVYADSRAFIDRFEGISIKCNDQEALSLTGHEAQGGFEADRVFEALRALQRTRERPVFITCNRHGVAVMDKGGPRLLPAVPQHGPLDVVGAGDATSAGIVSALCADATPVEAAQLGMLCAGVTVRKLGTTGTATPQEVLDIWEEMPRG